MRVFYLLFCSCNLFLLVSSFGESQNDGVYIVYMGARRNDHAHLVSQLLMDRENDLLVHTYGKSFSGFAAHLSDEEAESMARQPEVVSVFRDQTSKLHTTRSWDFLMSQNAQFKYDSNLMMNSQRLSCSIGADTIIGVLDSGIWPEHPSFDDKLIKDPIPTHWKGEFMHDNSSIPFKCNRKLIGARYYNNVTARDEESHGTHVASIAAGSPVWGASYKGFAEGIARGGSPCSRIAAYRVCDANLMCQTSDVLKGIDDAIDDGVDVLSISLSSTPDDVLDDVIAIGAFHVVERGITVVCSVGNQGSAPGAIRNFAPWILSVGASTIDRVLKTSVVLGGNNRGTGMYFGGLENTAVYPLTDGRSASSNQARVADAMNCIPGSLEDAKVKGKIVLCYYTDDSDGVVKFAALKKQGAIGVICSDIYFYTDAYDYSEFFHIPFAAVSDEDGAKIQSYISSARKPLATLLPTVTILHHKPAPAIAEFSSRGTPSYGKLCLIKPDVVAPGLNILAGVPPGKNKDLVFEFHSGTSMSCPHVSGVAAIIKSVHPTWSPSAISSAIMTTAIQTNNLHSPIQTHNRSVATPRDMGAGEINPIGSLWPGLVYETRTADYVQFLCNIGYNASAIRIMSSTLPDDFSCPSNSSPHLIYDMNYPSIFIKGLIANVSKTVKRTVINVGDAWSTYTATVVVPAGVQVQVVPNILRFTENVKTLTFQVSFKLTATSHDDVFGSITWFSGKYNVRSPLFVSNA